MPFLFNVHDTQCPLFANISCIFQTIFFQTELFQTTFFQTVTFQIVFSQTVFSKTVFFQNCIYPKLYLSKTVFFQNCIFQTVFFRTVFFQTVLYGTVFFEVYSSYASSKLCKFILEGSPKCTWSSSVTHAAHNTTQILSKFGVHHVPMLPVW